MKKGYRKICRKPTERLVENFKMIMTKLVKRKINQKNESKIHKNRSFESIEELGGNCRKSTGSLTRWPKQDF